MKVLYVVHQYFPECWSGTEQYCLALSREARRRGLEVAILSLWPDAGRDDPPMLVEDRPYDDCSVFRLRHWWGLLPNEQLREHRGSLVAARFRALLLELRPDVVHFLHLRNLGSDLIEVAKGVGARTVVHLMDFWFLCPRFTLLRSDGTVCDGPPERGLGCISCHLPELDGVYADPGLSAFARDCALAAGRVDVGWSRGSRFAALIGRRERLLEHLSRADAVIAPSMFLSEMFVRNGFPAKRMRVIGYGIEAGRVERRPVRRPRDPLRLSFAGVLSPWKGASVVIEAVRAYAGRVQLSIYGNLEERMFADHIADLKARAAGDTRIEFCGAFEAARISEVLADTDVLIVPSLWYENTPFVILEALAAGVPVAASALGGMAELVVPGLNGFRFPPGDAGALTKLIEEWASDPNLLSALDPQSRGTIASAFDEILQLYEVGS